MVDLSDRLELEKSLTKSPNPTLFSIPKQTFQKTQGQQMPMIGYKRGSHTRSKTKSKPLARLKKSSSPQNLS